MTSPPANGVPDGGGGVAKVSLYKRREKLFVHYVGGYFQNIRLYTGWPLLLGYFLLPWINWHGRQAVLFDLPARKFYIFGLTLWPQDFILLAWLLIIAAFALFLVTSLVGRLWCGYTCPQTVWTSIFLWIEKKTEGSRNQRKKLEKQAMSADKFARRSAKHGLWIGVALLTGFTFVAYFSPARQLLGDLVQFRASLWAYAWILFFSAATYINAGWLREQVCIYMCPYARFQSAMIDRDTLVVTYDEPRGEPRGARKRAAEKTGLGDCVDCQLCVQVCPTGIDIRQGLQIECIQCAHCIDACNQVMDKMEYPRGLIRYDSEANVHDRQQQTKPRYLRPRTLGYMAVLVIMIGLFTVKLGTRVPFGIDVLRERGELYHLEAGKIRNDYTLKISNKSQSPMKFAVTATANGEELEHNGEALMLVPVGDVSSIAFSVYRKSEAIESTFSSLTIALCEQTRKQCQSAETRFLAPSP
ncbi:MAG: cytochrome c oxidase accessory protein CcoG [Gammaproteobacteria bacterium]